MKALTATDVVFNSKLYVCNRRYNAKRIIKQLCVVTGIDLSSSDPRKATVKFLDGIEDRIFVSVVDADVVFVDGSGEPSLLEATSKFKLAELAKRKAALDAAKEAYYELKLAIVEEQ